MKIFIITHNYPPAVTSGGAVYFRTLADCLKSEKNIKGFVILTEYSDEVGFVKKEGKSIVVRVLFPRAIKRRTKRPCIAVRLFAFIYNQFVLAVALPLIAITYKPNALHIHASFFKLGRLSSHYNYFLHCLLHLIKRLKLSKILVDVRGPALCLKRFEGFDKILCCSENAMNQFVNLGTNKKKCVLIPVPFSLADLKMDRHIDMSAYAPYICFAARIENNKGVFELIAAFNKLDYYRELKLVFVGVNLEGQKFARMVDKSPQMFYIGPKSQADVISIISQSELFILPSKSEGLPRSCLEAIALGSKVLLPPGIPEFYRHCSKFVIQKIQSSEIKKMIIRRLDSNTVPKFPFEKHNPIYIARQMLNVYTQL